MSYRAIRMVRDRCTGTTAARFVLWVIAEHAGDDLSAFPSVARISALTGLSESRVRQAIGELETAGELTVERPPGKVSVYRLTPDTPPGSGGVTPPGSGGVPPQTVEGYPSRIWRTPLQDLEDTPPGSGGEPVSEPVNEPTTPRVCASAGMRTREAAGGGGGDASEDLQAVEALRAFGAAMSDAKLRELVRGRGRVVPPLIASVKRGKCGVGAAIAALQGRGVDLEALAASDGNQRKRSGRRALEQLASLPAAQRARAEASAAGKHAESWNHWTPAVQAPFVLKEAQRLGFIVDGAALAPAGPIG